MFFVQECGEAPERLGLQADEMLKLLKGIVTLHVDTMKMVSTMQRQRAWRAMGGDDPERTQEDPEQSIISEKQKEVEKKKLEQKLAFEMGKSQSFLQQLNRGRRPFRQISKPTPRRPRFARGGMQTTSDIYDRPAQTSPFQRRSFRGRGGRGRGRGGRGQGGRGRGRGRSLTRTPTL